MFNFKLNGLVQNYFWLSVGFYYNWANAYFVFSSVWGLMVELNSTWNWNDKRITFAFRSCSRANQAACSWSLGTFKTSKSHETKKMTIQNRNKVGLNIAYIWCDEEDNDKITIQNRNKVGLNIANFWIWCILWCIHFLLMSVWRYFK